jgi:saccharopine dehydrogenase (NADP+, L-glutamate forming)
VFESGEFEGYANRDSLSYRKSYGLDDIPTLFRGTLRRKGYSEAWNIFVQLGMTDDTYKLENSASITNREFINMFLSFDDALMVEEKLCKQFSLTTDSVIFQKIAWLGAFSENKVGIENASPAQILQAICEKKWTLGAEDKDMIVMQHQFEYLQNGEQKKLNSSLLVFAIEVYLGSSPKTNKEEFNFFCSPFCKYSN